MLKCISSYLVAFISLSPCNGSICLIPFYSFLTASASESPSCSFIPASAVISQFEPSRMGIFSQSTSEGSGSQVKLHWLWGATLKLKLSFLRFIGKCFVPPSEERLKNNNTTQNYNWNSFNSPLFTFTEVLVGCCCHIFLSKAWCGEECELQSVIAVTTWSE